MLRYTQSDGTAVAYYDYARDAAGRIVRLARENNLAVYFTFDEIDRLKGEIERKASDSTQIYAFFYDYDAANNRLQMRREAAAGVETESAYYAYDAANQMARKQVRTPPSTVVDTYFGYDSNGSTLREYVVGTGTTYYEYGSNQLISKITPVSGSPWNFYYDSRLNRYRIDRGGTDSYYLWDGLNLLEERTSGGALVARYTYGYSRINSIGNICEIFKPGTPDKTYTLALDHRGTANVLLDESQTEIGRRLYDAFGRIISETGTWPVDVGYSSNWLWVKIGDKWYGLSKYRLYDPETGTFLSRDFLNYLNKYRAFGNNPVGQVDRDGLFSIDPATIDSLLDNHDISITNAQYETLFRYRIYLKIGKYFTGDTKKLTMDAETAVQDIITKAINTNLSKIDEIYDAWSVLHAIHDRLYLDYLATLTAHALRCKKCLTEEQKQGLRELAEALDNASTTAEVTFKIIEELKDLDELVPGLKVLGPIATLFVAVTTPLNSREVPLRLTKAALQATVSVLTVLAVEAGEGPPGWIAATVDLAVILYEKAIHEPRNRAILHASEEELERLCKANAEGLKEEERKILQLRDFMKALERKLKKSEYFKKIEDFENLRKKVIFPS